jgi:outer membrane protein insertion porin family
MKLKQLTATLMMLSLSPLALADFTIQDIRVEGLQRTEPSTVFSYLPVKVGDTFTDARGEEIIKNLYATGFFDDVRVETWATKCCSPWWSAPPSAASTSPARKCCKAA